MMKKALSCIDFSNDKSVSLDANSFESRDDRMLVGLDSFEFSRVRKIKLPFMAPGRDLIIMMDKSSQIVICSGFFVEDLKIRPLRSEN